jgi:hypothetical protein
MAVAGSCIAIYGVIDNSYEKKFKAYQDSIGVTNDYVCGIAINDRVKKLIVQGKSESVFSFYDKFTKNRFISFLIVSGAISSGVPINISIALAREESFFDVLAENKNKDGSIDYSIFQLNSKTYKDYTRDYLMMLENNVRLGIEHLRNDYKKYGFWVSSIISYNSGDIENVKSSTIEHAARVLKYETFLDQEFNKVF